MTGCYARRLRRRGNDYHGGSGRDDDDGYRPRPTTTAPAETTTTVAAGGGTIKIGALLDFTGPVAELGPIFQAGIEAALEEVNYMVAGKKVELIIEDSATSVDTAVAKAKKLVEQDGVKIIIGPLMGDAHLALSPYCKEKGVIITSLINGMWDTVQRRDYLIYPTTVDAQTYPFGTYCVEKLGYKKAVVVHADYAGKAGYAAGWMNGFKAAGGEVIQVIPTPVGSPDYSRVYHQHARCRRRRRDVRPGRPGRGQQVHLSVQPGR